MMDAIYASVDKRKYTVTDQQAKVIHYADDITVFVRNESSVKAVLGEVAVSQGIAGGEVRYR